MSVRSAERRGAVEVAVGRLDHAKRDSAGDVEFEVVEIRQIAGGIQPDEPSRRSLEGRVEVPVRSADEPVVRGIGEVQQEVEDRLAAVRVDLEERPPGGGAVEASIRGLVERRQDRRAFVAEVRRGVVDGRDGARDLVAKQVSDGRRWNQSHRVEVPVRRRHRARKKRERAPRREDVQDREPSRGVHPVEHRVVLVLRGASLGRRVGALPRVGVEVPVGAAGEAVDRGAAGRRVEDAKRRQAAGRVDPEECAEDRKRVDPGGRRPVEESPRLDEGRVRGETVRGGAGEAVQRRVARRVHAENRSAPVRAADLRRAPQAPVARDDDAAGAGAVPVASEVVERGEPSRKVESIQRSLIVETGGRGRAVQTSIRRDDHGRGRAPRTAREVVEDGQPARRIHAEEGSRVRRAAAHGRSVEESVGSQRETSLREGTVRARERVDVRACVAADAIWNETHDRAERELSPREWSPRTGTRPAPPADGRPV